MASVPGLPKSKRNTLILGTLVAILIAFGFGGYLYMRNEANRQNQNVTDINSPSAPSTENPIGENPGERPAKGDEYIVLGDWRIKLTVPYELQDTEIRYYERSDGDDQKNYAFTTARIQALGGQCEKQPFGNTIVLSRFTEKPMGIPHGVLLNEEPIAEYYYVQDAPIASCSSVDDEGRVTRSASDIETRDASALKELAKTISLAD